MIKTALDQPLADAHKQAFLQHSTYIDFNTSAVATLAKELRGEEREQLVIVRRCFEFVRDQIKHSVDYQMNPVTCMASDVLKHHTGYCYAKSHLLAALLRANAIPTGMCYQRLTFADDQPPYCLHGLNAVYLDDFGWYRIDARGNKAGVDAQFTPPVEQLAYPIKVAGEADIPGVWSEPMPEIVNCLTTYATFDVVRDNLPDYNLSDCGLTSET